MKGIWKGFWYRDGGKNVITLRVYCIFFLDYKVKTSTELPFVNENVSIVPDGTSGVLQSLQTHISYTISHSRSTRGSMRMRHVCALWTHTLSQWGKHCWHRYPWFVGAAASEMVWCISCFLLTRRFWNQILTCFSVRLSMEAILVLSCFWRYFFERKHFSKYWRWEGVNTGLGRGGLRCELEQTVEKT